MRTAILFLFLVLPACAARQYVDADLSKQSNFIVITLGDSDAYLIDPRTETCLLRLLGANGNMAITPVSCALLKRNLPEAAPHITWVAEEATTTR